MRSSHGAGRSQQSVQLSQSPMYPLLLAKPSPWATCKCAHPANTCVVSIAGSVLAEICVHQNFASKINDTGTDFSQRRESCWSPFFFKQSDGLIVQVFLDQLLESDGAGEVPAAVQAALASKACRSAIMFGDALSRDEAQALVDRLKTTAFCFSCAHGRPTAAPLAHIGAVRQALDCVRGAKIDGCRESLSLNGLRKKLITCLTKT